MGNWEDELIDSGVRHEGGSRENYPECRPKDDTNPYSAKCAGCTKKGTEIELTFGPDPLFPARVTWLCAPCKREK